MNRTTYRGSTVGEVASLAGVTVRTLHHYERIGLLAPNRRTEAGYRLYDEADCERLARILYYRELGFPLEDIAAILDAAGTDHLTQLHRQHALLLERLRRTQAMVASLEREMEAHMRGYNLTAEDKLEVFGNFDPDDYDAEARERWGGSNAWAQSRARTQGYTRDDWRRIRAEMDRLNEQFAAAMNAGTLATSAAVMALAEEHRQSISRWFYDCSHELHRGLGAMYADDPRFTANIDQAAPGLAPYIRDAFVANADRAEALS